MNKIPKQGLTGAVLLREAVSEFKAVIDLVRTGLIALLYPGRNENAWVSIEAIYPDRVVIDFNGKKIQYAYSIDANNTVTFGEGVQVVEEFVPLNAKEAGLIGAGQFLEAVGDENTGKWWIKVVEVGLSKNNVLYPEAVLREAAPLFNGARVFVKGDVEHLKGEGKDFRQLEGGLSDSVFVEATATQKGYVKSLLTFIVPTDGVAFKVKEAAKRQLTHLFGFSIDAEGTATKTKNKGGQKFKEATSITKVNSVDLIVEPGAGGQVIRMAESFNPNKETDMYKQQMLEAVMRINPGKFAGKSIDDITDDELQAAFKEAFPGNQSSQGNQNTGLTQEQIDKQIRMVEARAEMKVKIATSNLPQAAKDRLLADFGGRAHFVEADVTAAIDSERTYLAKFVESGHVNLNFDEGARVEDKTIRIAGMLDAFFDPTHADHRSTQSFKECYIEITGDTKVTGEIKNCDRARLRESVGADFRESFDSTSLSNVIGNSITRQMIAEYNAATEYQAWRQLVTIVPVSDFRVQDRTRWGGYGDLPIVGERDPYPALASPTDEKATYKVDKRGGVEDFTLEMVKNDDVGVIRRIPVKLGRAAQRTLAKFVFDFWRLNQVIYDGLTFFHASHGNLGTNALSSASLAAARLAMMKQTEMNSGDRIGVGPKNLLVSVDGQEDAVNLFNRSTNNDKTFIQQNVLNIIPVWYWTDANDWCAVADPKDIPSVEIGFLDGQEEPQLYVQDNPTSGSLFTNDVISYKIKHPYGGTVLDFRGSYKGVVA